MADNLPAASVPRTPGGRFAPGGPGRPVGSKNKVGRAALAALGELASEAVAVIRRKLGEGDLAAAKLVMQHVLPQGRLIELPSNEPSAWADALAAGDVSPAEASTAATALAKIHDVAEIHELRARLDEIESLLLARKG